LEVFEAASLCFVHSDREYQQALCSTLLYVRYEAIFLSLREFLKVTFFVGFEGSDSGSMLSMAAAANAALLSPSTDTNVVSDLVRDG
jgi:hypothetical protein